MANNQDNLGLATQKATLSTVLDTISRTLSRRIVPIVHIIIIKLVLVLNIYSGRVESFSVFCFFLNRKLKKKKKKR